MESSATNSPVPSSPLARYQHDLRSGAISADPAQARAVDELQRLFEQLSDSHGTGRLNWSQRLLRRSAPRWTPVAGVYVWGRVGRGKTYLVDTFFDCLPFAEKSRIHFHSFMRQTHLALNDLHHEADPLNIVASDWAKRHRVLCLDEFHVGDITDAMLLANLLRALFADGVTVIATSNEAPSDLYSGGLQRERFLPAIALLESHLVVLELAGEQDYRLRALEQAPVYYCCAAGECDKELDESFSAIAPEHGANDADMLIEGRNIRSRRLADGIAWFAFHALCQDARSTADYIEIARLCHTVIISDVPKLGRDDSDAARRFINLIDELYDRRVNVIISATAEPEALYAGTRLAKPFLRTASRLREMRSHDYLSEAHISD